MPRVLLQNAPQNSENTLGILKNVGELQRYAAEHTQEFQYPVYTLGIYVHICDHFNGEFHLCRRDRRNYARKCFWRVC